jgi:hypothetical protein
MARLGAAQGRMTYRGGSPASGYPSASPSRAGDLAMKVWDILRWIWGMLRCPERRKSRESRSLSTGFLRSY